MANPPKRHHFLPRFFLHGFSRDGLLWVYDRELKEIRLQTPKSTAVKKHFYTYQEKDGTKNTDTEDFLAIIENHSAVIIKKLERKEVINDDERTFLSQFLALLPTRTPKFRNFFNQDFELRVRKWIKDIAREPERIKQIYKEIEKEDGDRFKVPTEELVDFMKDETNYSLNVLPHTSIGGMLKSSLILIPKIFCKRWVILHAHKETSFLCSDNLPVLLFPRNKYQGDRPEFGVVQGFLNQEAAIFFPLSQRIGLLLIDEGDYFRHIDSYPKIAVRSANLAIATGCHRFLIARDELLLKSILRKTKIVQNSPTDT